VTPCGGCRQKIKEFAGPDVKVTMATLDGKEMVMTVAELLPGAFDDTYMVRA
jgi:cytidine deaminase